MRKRLFRQRRTVQGHDDALQIGVTAAVIAVCCAHEQKRVLRTAEHFFSDAPQQPTIHSRAPVRRHCDQNVAIAGSFLDDHVAGRSFFHVAAYGEAGECPGDVIEVNRAAAQGGISAALLFFLLVRRQGSE